MAIGKYGKYNWDYSEYSDILNIHETGVRTSYGNEVGDFTVDFDKTGRIIGVEVMYATEFLKSQRIAKDGLSDLKGAAFTAETKGDTTTIRILLKFATRKASMRLPALLREKSVAVEA
ncbi:DUF2283 domain-containing protein [Candidatus Woesearchaeota archaeon]|nr:DUF2283 domain-containing protein [Candidatus Woesearchaeota archaeon]